ncbi:MAG TPA: outer membrane protein assembly factor BamA [Geobacteraceae bacterium]
MLAVPLPVQADGEKIVDVQIKGNRRIEKAAIANVVKLKGGDILFADKVDSDVRAIYKLGHFDDVKAETGSTEKGIVLTYLVTEKSVVREVKVEGTKELSQDKVREAIEIKANSIYSAKDLAKSVKKVKKLYADEGYYLAEVDTKVEQRSPTELKITFTVREGKKILIKMIRFEGNRAFPSRKLRGLMETTEDWFLAWLTGAGVYKEDVLKNDVTLIADHYFNNGYINVKVGEPTVSLLADKNGLDVLISITEGDQYRTGQLDFRGDLLESKEVLARAIKLKTGEVFSRSSLRGDVFTLTDLYADKGYAFANVNPLTKITPEQKSVDLTFDFEKGEKIYIDRISVAGNTKTRDKVVRRELRLAEGDLYSSTGLKRSKQNLMNLGFFEEANLATVKGSADNKLNLNVDIKEKPTGTFSIGGGYSSLDGFIGQGSVQQANFMGLGLKANASVSIGGKSSTYNLGLTDPYFMDTRWTLGGDLYRTQRDYVDYTRRATGGDIKAGYQLTDTLNTFWLYKYEDVSVFNLSQSLQDSIRLGHTVAPATSSTTSSVTASLTRNNTDYRVDPSSGMINTVSVDFAGLGGTNRYIRAQTQNSWYTPVFLGTVFSVHSTLGHMMELGKPIQIDDKYYLGGISTVRGYNGRTISPYVETTIVSADINGVATSSTSRAFTGGDTEAVLNLEYVVPLLKDAGLKGVIFFDAGNSINGIGNMFNKFQTSYGLGIRWFSPIGPLRLEYGIPLNPRDNIDKASGKLEFSIGSFF